MLMLYILEAENLHLVQQYQYVGTEAEGGSSMGTHGE